MSGSRSSRSTASGPPPRGARSGRGVGGGADQRHKPLARGAPAGHEAAVDDAEPVAAAQQRRGQRVGAEDAAVAQRDDRRRAAAVERVERRVALDPGRQEPAADLHRALPMRQEQRHPRPLVLAVRLGPLRAVDAEQSHLARSHAEDGADQMEVPDLAPPIAIEFGLG